MTDTNNITEDNDRIQMYFHCKNCLDKIDLGPGSGFGDEQLEVGWTKEGFRVQCRGCGKVVVDLDFLGQKVDFYSPDPEVRKKKLEAVDKFYKEKYGKQ